MPSSQILSPTNFRSRLNDLTDDEIIALVSDLERDGLLDEKLLRKLELIRDAYETPYENGVYQERSLFARLLKNHVLELYLDSQVTLFYIREAARCEIEGNNEADRRRASIAVQDSTNSQVLDVESDTYEVEFTIPRWIVPLLLVGALVQGISLGVRKILSAFSPSRTNK